MATNNSSTSTSAQEDYLDPSLRNSEDDMEMCALLDKKKDYSDITTGGEENYVHPLLCNVLDQTESAYKTYFSCEDFTRLFRDRAVPFAAPVQTSTPIPDNRASQSDSKEDGENFLDISRDLINSAINNLGMPRAFQNELRSFFEDVMFQVSRYKVYLYLYEPIKPNLHQPETVEH
ncbi:hypothetical protein Bbelb_262010 [Branchiostoma belcheri]|nr:hypothetical protein Bbelb_447370 [Branchiostoma belcheri]KAI8495785.1 hypothetical protein Bbelb_262010 [Branchiostoma belcheri]